MRYVCLSSFFWRIRSEISNANQREKIYSFFSECSSRNWRKLFFFNFWCIRLYSLIKIYTMFSFDNWLFYFHEIIKWLKRTFAKKDHYHLEKWRILILNTFRFIERTRYDFATSRSNMRSSWDISNILESRSFVRADLLRRHHVRLSKK